MGEHGGLNLYGFVGNDGVNGIDVLGLQVQNPFRTEGTREPEPCDPSSLADGSKPPCCCIKVRVKLRFRKEGAFGIGAGDFERVLRPGEAFDMGSHDGSRIEPLIEVVESGACPSPLPRLVITARVWKEGSGKVVSVSDSPNDNINKNLPRPYMSINRELSEVVINDLEEITSVRL